MRSTTSRIVVCVALALSLPACERVGEKLDGMRPNAPADSGRARPSQIDDVPAPLPPGLPPWEEFPEPDILFSLDAWDAASTYDKEEAGRLVAGRLPWFEYVGIETFASGGQKHEVALFTHPRSGLDFVLVPVGSFKMGSPGSEDGRSFDETRRTVTLTRPYLICRTEVTQAAWSLIRSKNPAHFDGDRNPVETVTIIDIERFLMRAKMELPTEAQWEYACRAGTTTSYSYGDGESDLGDHAWYETNAGGTTHPVAEKKPNAFGLHDVHGNVLEWCRDGYAVPKEGDATDPEGPSSASDKVVKGGSWQNQARVHRSAFRLQSHPGDKQPGIGFRPVKVLEQPK